MNAVKNVWREEPVLTAAGLLGFTLAAFCAVMMAVQGVIVPPEGNLLSAFSFNAALGLFLITTAFLVPLAGFSRRKRQIFCWSYLVCAFTAMEPKRFSICAVSLLGTVRPAGLLIRLSAVYLD
ncbi:hypothetical protein M3221_05395 [Domibacillus indicus]|uniref:hypothetical protein n=1 Tax=Domibacillus indicus TaxID=1437523 RepID=UPI002040BDCA|nr:hypothetical protein [Domibacillus indicus]MCM3787854.1 hypothetical protein [Domibacillus indicus]